ncbi:hypothetical protein MPTK1_1g27230 [Marchantia polymorpha subsp. ruderalis]|uniref:RING-type domain-containing protein n=2 Tax=Marchantia polymorpha TaxID=3197 RepID=A0AAF6AUT3_MARPO|nr:hypothetical protein MARPO_0002s0155 [Marchantia polymorpha]BBN00204.1 hypothetical protein Mp_1g27230 [Marchantia polymorpha subsp. ruderalis]|eukprot:PTQ49680.1 hypothetical protein MARPO_0002s0155 [Marchantia polymorpha]
MAIVQRSGSVGEPLRSKKVVDFDRESKLDELQKEMERLQREIEELKEEFQRPLLLKEANDDAKAKDPLCFTCAERKKGAALFPCGHTFCWKCTSQLRRGKGPCPFCYQQFWTAVPASNHELGNDDWSRYHYLG